MDRFKKYMKVKQPDSVMDCIYGEKEREISRVSGQRNSQDNGTFTEVGSTGGWVS